MKKFTCSFQQFDEICETMQRMDYHAGPYAPAARELMERVEPELEAFILFLLWVNETGFETDENRMPRRIIREILRTHIELYEEVEADVP